ncbi:MAG TPA: GNAT family N-acetyltransferase [Acidimicrobiales bacterium]|jgi:predicted GNAT family acetyltransferase|nr:GNAT family N-acetyltransferase [Acidimicrobiales bacterium]
MHVQRCEDARRFLDETRSYRAREPMRTNVLGSVAATVIAGDDRYAERFWWVVRDDDGAVVGAAMRTAPYALSIGPMPDAAVEAVARAVAAVDDDVPSVAGFGGCIDAFLAAYATTGTPGGRRAVGAVHRQVLYTATSVRAPEVPGTIRVATEPELGHAEAWYLDFTEEVDGVRPPASAVEREVLLGTLRDGRLRWWCDEGEVVSMAAHAVPVANPGGAVTRIGPVYTPPSRRRRGYAAALTAALTELLLARGSSVMLYADAANATSRGVYERLGYTALDELVRTTLAPR